jgi:hypothetical protein
MSWLKTKHMKSIRKRQETQSMYLSKNIGFDVLPYVINQWYFKELKCKHYKPLYTVSHSLV